MYQLDGKTLQYGRAFKTEDGRQFPANWLKSATEEEKNALGIVQVHNTVPVAIVDQRFYWGPENPKDLDQLKGAWKAKQSQLASSLLTPSDWRVVKAAEVTDYAVSSEWLAYRAAVRTACNTRQTEIDACETVDALKELLYGSATITRQQTDSEGTGVVDSDGNPVMETVANPAIATAWPTPIEE
jgi:hypothetical protein